MYSELGVASTERSNWNGDDDEVHNILSDSVREIESRMGSRLAASYSDLIHPVHRERRVFTWEINSQAEIDIS
jgi:hypothetical protein